MNYTVRALKIVSINNRTVLEDYEKNVLNWDEAEKEQNRLKSLGEYTNIRISKIRKPLN